MATSLFKNGPKQGGKVLSGFPKCKMAVMCLSEKGKRSDEYWSGTSKELLGKVK